MTDQERATAFVCTVLGFDESESTGDVETLREEFGRVREDERVAIGLFLRRRVERWRADGPTATADAVEVVAGWIESGEHS